MQYSLEGWGRRASLWFAQRDRCLDIYIYIEMSVHVSVHVRPCVRPFPAHVRPVLVKGPTLTPVTDRTL
jgi:hypothetical protein